MNYERLSSYQWSFASIQTSLVSRPALGSFPRTDFPQTLASALDAVKPKGMAAVQTMLCGTSANENAIKTAFIW